MTAYLSSKLSVISWYGYNNHDWYLEFGLRLVKQCHSVFIRALLLTYAVIRVCHIVDSSLLPKQTQICVY